MKTHALVLAQGRDRVGVADDLAAALGDRKIDIEHSRMTALSGWFALIVQVCGEQDQVRSLDHDLVSLGKRLGFQLQLEPIHKTRPPEVAPQLMLEIFSRGPSGFNAVTAVLKRRGVNIEDLESDAYPDSWTSALMFHMKARLTVPASYSVASLKEELRELERERKLEIAITPIPSRVSEPTTVR